MKKAYLTISPGQTQELGMALAREILKNNSRRAAIVALEGNLGGGKTTFLQGLAKGLGIKEKIISPTFVIQKRFKILNSRFKNFYHLDCYRIQKPEELLELGFRDIVSDPQNIIALEWADRIKKVLPKNMLWLRFEFINKNTRRIIMLK